MISPRKDILIGFHIVVPRDDSHPAPVPSIKLCFPKKAMEELATLPTADIVQTLIPLLAYSMPELNTVLPGGSILAAASLSQSLAENGKSNYDWLKDQREKTGMSFTLMAPLNNLSGQLPITHIENPIWIKQSY